MKVKVQALSKLLVSSILLMTLFSITASAATTTLFSHSDKTYVTSSHPDDYFADTYTGVASVIGTDRISEGTKTYSFAWTEISYDVQGTISSDRANSTGSYDSKQRTTTLTVKDKWNTGPKTRAYYDYGLRLFSNMRAGEDVKSVESVE